MLQGRMEGCHVSKRRYERGHVRTGIIPGLDIECTSCQLDRRGKTTGARGASVIDRRYGRGKPGCVVLVGTGLDRNERREHEPTQLSRDALSDHSIHFALTTLLHNQIDPPLFTGSPVPLS
jgi:hypothetical protein